MANLPHLYFRNPPEGNVPFHYVRRGMNPKEEKDDEPKNDPRPETFSSSLRTFNNAISQRHEERVPDLEICQTGIRLVGNPTIKVKFEKVQSDR